MVVGAAFALVAIGAFSLPGEARRSWVQGVFGWGGGTLAVLAAFTAALWWADAKRLERMRRGEGILARWTVSVEQWRLFIQQSKNTDRQPGTLPNVIAFSVEPPASGAEVIFSDDAINVGGDFHSIPKDIEIQVFRTFVELRETMHGSRSSIKFLMYRFPLAPGAEAAMAHVQNSYRAAYVEAAATGWTKVWVLLGIIAAVFILAVIAIKYR
jgi:hypothetical protein